MLLFLLRLICVGAHWALFFISVEEEAYEEIEEEAPKDEAEI